VASAVHKSRPGMRIKVSAEIAFKATVRDA